MLSDKYIPYTLNGIIGNRSSVESLKKLGAEMLAGSKVKPIMIYGPSGTGKTAAARALAYENGFEVLEFNSSDYRDADTIEKKAMPASMTRGLFNKRIVIIFDEIDELSAKFDAGAERTITKLINSSKQPVVFTASDYWDRKISFLRTKVDRIEFKKVDREEIRGFLKRIMEKEGKTVSEEILDEIVKRSSGDVRGAMNDLEMMFGAKPELIESLSMRDRKMEIFSVLDKIFLSGNFDIARYAAINTDADMGMLINWIDENIPNRYVSKGEIRSAYFYASKASRFYNNASRTNYYGYLRYAQIMLSSGVAMANTGRISMLNNYSFPANIMHMSRAKKGKEALTAIAGKLSYVLHANRKDIIRDGLPLIDLMMRAAEKESGAEAAARIAASMGLEEDEVKVLREYYKYSSK